MFAEVTYEDGEIETIELERPSSRKVALRNGVWTFKSVDGREVSVEAQRAMRVEFSEIRAPDDASSLERGREREA